jgi:hypothetical protein
MEDDKTQRARMKVAHEEEGENGKKKKREREVSEAKNNCGER